jgi:hypothetical protein
MRKEGNQPGMRGQEREEGRQQDVHGADTVVHDRGATSRRALPAVQPLHDVLTAAIRQRVLRRAARDQRCTTRLVGLYLRAMP